MTTMTNAVDRARNSRIQGRIRALAAAPLACVVVLAAAPSTPVACAGGSAPIPVSQTRTVLGDSFVIASPNGDQDFQSITWPAGGPFDAVVDAHATLDQADASLVAGQSTMFAAFGVQGTGDAAAAAQVAGGGAVAYAVGSSECAFTFDVSAPTPYRIVAMLVAGPQSQSRVKLAAAGGGALVDVVAVGGSTPVHADGTLLPGRYTFLCGSFASAALSVPGIDADAAGFVMHFSTSPDPADLDNDGVVGAADLGLLLGAWGPCGACPADLDASGAVDGADLAAVLAGWG